jgi:hypothetical protein
MAHRALSLSLVLILASALSGICQCVQAPCPMGCYQPKPCVVRPSPPPMVRTVQVNVPVPCPTPTCGMPRRCPPHPCAPPVLAPTCPTRPVNVRVEVRVRPEAPKPCIPKRYCCMNPPVFEPIFCQAARMVRSMMVAPLRIGEGILGHGVRRPPCSPPIPIDCPSCPVAPCPQLVRSCGPIPYQCIPPCPPVVGCALPGPRIVRKTKNHSRQAYIHYRNTPIQRNDVTGN